MFALILFVLFLRVDQKKKKVVKDPQKEDLCRPYFVEESVDPPGLRPPTICNLKR